MLTFYLAAVFLRFAIEKKFKLVIDSPNKLKPKDSRQQHYTT